jgi:hypothetical protein
MSIEATITELSADDFWNGKDVRTKEIPLEE